MTIESSYLGYDLFKERLKNEGVELISSDNHYSVFDHNLTKTQEKIEEKERKKQVDEEAWMKLKEESPDKLKRHIWFCRIINAIGVLYFFTPIILRESIILIPREVLIPFIFTGITLFIVTVYYSLKNSYIIEIIGERRGGKKPHLEFALFGTMFFSLLTALSYQVIYSFTVWVTIIAIAIIIILIILIFTREKKIKKFILRAVIGATLIFSFGATIVVNCAFDTSQTQRLPASIVNKHASANTNDPTFSFTVEFIDKPGDTLRMYVERDEYSTYNIGEQITLCAKQGLLRLRWITCTTVH